MIKEPDNLLLEVKRIIKDRKIFYLEKSKYEEIMNGDSLKKSFLNEIDKDTTIQTLITDNPDAKNIEIKYDVNNDKYTFETTNHVKTYLEKTLKFFNFEDVFKKLENFKNRGSEEYKPEKHNYFIYKDDNEDLVEKLTNFLNYVPTMNDTDKNRLENLKGDKMFEYSTERKEIEGFLAQLILYAKKNNVNLKNLLIFDYPETQLKMLYFYNNDDNDIVLPADRKDIDKVNIEAIKGAEYDRKGFKFFSIDKTYVLDALKDAFEGKENIMKKVTKLLNNSKEGTKYQKIIEGLEKGNEYKNILNISEDIEYQGLVRYFIDLPENLKSLDENNSKEGNIKKAFGGENNNYFILLKQLFREKEIVIVCAYSNYQINELFFVREKIMMGFQSIKQIEILDFRDFIKDFEEETTKTLTKIQKSEDMEAYIKEYIKKDYIKDLVKTTFFNGKENDKKKFILYMNDKKNDIYKDDKERYEKLITEIFDFIEKKIKV